MGEIWTAPLTKIQELVESTAGVLGLRTLPIHAHESLFAFLLYLSLDKYVAPFASSKAFPTIYKGLNRRTRLNWNVHVVSLFQSLLICGLALRLILTDGDRNRLDAYGRLWGYNRDTGMIQAFAAGYFAWDVLVSTVNLSILGPSSLAHAIGALLIVNIGFRPFAHFYGISFVLYELSTPFLNFHWFLDVCKMTGSKYQLYNGILLLMSFFACRLVWGTYLSVQIYIDIFTALRKPLLDASHSRKLGLKSTSIFATNSLPTWLVILYLGSNTMLTILNFYWFGRMLKAGAKRFDSKGNGRRRSQNKED